MRAIGFGVLGFLLGGVGGFWVGLMLGLIYVDLAQVSCLDGLCGPVAGGVGLLGALLCGLFGSVCGVRRGARRQAAGAPA
jgi:hypothetical protein